MSKNKSIGEDDVFERDTDTKKESTVEAKPVETPVATPTETTATAEAALSNVGETYDKMISDTDTHYNAQIQAAKDWEAKQTELQNAQTDFAIEQIEQQKGEAKETYGKEQSAAYVDYQKQTAKHGVNAEQMAALGLSGAGYSESALVSMYNTYQNRVAVAKQSYEKAVVNYNNAITQARLENNAALAELAYQSLQTQLELALKAFQYKNTLMLAQVEAENAKSTKSSTLTYEDILGLLGDEGLPDLYIDKTNTAKEIGDAVEYNVVAKGAPLRTQTPSKEFSKVSK